jgi:hypothetical protein
MSFQVESVQNPAVEGETATPIEVAKSAAQRTTATELEAALRGLREGKTTEHEAMAVLDRLMDERMERLLANKTDGPFARGTGLGLESLAKAVFARMTEAPTNWHQCIVFFLTSTEADDEPMKQWLPLMLAGSWLMVLIQCAACLAVVIGVALPSCRSSDQCPDGQYCQVGFSNRCGFCGSNAPLIMQVNDVTGQTFNAIFDPNFAGYNTTLVKQVCDNDGLTCGDLCPLEKAEDLKGTGENYFRVSGDLNGRTCGQSCDFNYEHRIARGADLNSRDSVVIGFNSGGDWDLGYSTEHVRQWCEYCVYATTYDVDPVSQFGRMRDVVSAMGNLDWLALLFASFIVSFQLIGELKDIHLCTIALADAPNTVHHGWFKGLWVLNMLRKHMHPAVLLCHRGPITMRYTRVCYS